MVQTSDLSSALLHSCSRHGAHTRRGLPRREGSTCGVGSSGTRVVQDRGCGYSRTAAVAGTWAACRNVLPLDAHASTAIFRCVCGRCHVDGDFFSEWSTGRVPALGTHVPTSVPARGTHVPPEGRMSRPEGRMSRPEGRTRVPGRGTRVPGRGTRPSGRVPAGPLLCRRTTLVPTPRLKKDRGDP